jgi:hypothetical protein
MEQYWQLRDYKHILHAHKMGGLNLDTVSISRVLLILFYKNLPFDSK